MTAAADDHGFALEPLDLLLGEGTPAARQDLRERIGRDPLLALEVADTVDFLEECKQLRVVPSSLYAAKLAEVVRRADLRLRPAPALPLWRQVLYTTAAAAVAFAALAGLDPLGRRQPAARPLAAAPALPPVLAAPAPAPAVAADGHDAVLATMRRRFAVEAAPRLQAALDVAQRPAADPLRRWLDPQNALAVLAQQHQRRGDAATRGAALARDGAMAAADLRAQGLADAIGSQLTERLAASPVADRTAIHDVALAVRALLAAGPGPAARSQALARGSDWLAAALDRARGIDLAQGLPALAEVVAVHGWHAERFAAGAERFLAEFLVADEHVWGRARPELLQPAAPVAAVAEALRLCRWLPGFGCDPSAVQLVEGLLLGSLRERRDGGDRVELLAALVYGAGDRLDEAERDELERQLRRWKPAHLVPDFATLQQIAWGAEPGRLGFARLQRDLRPLVVVPDPGTLAARAGLCLCLTASYAAPRAPSAVAAALGD